LTRLHLLGIGLALWAQIAMAGEACSTSAVLAALQGEGFTRVDRVDALPSGLLDVFWRAIPNQAPDSKAFADPEEAFQSTDVVRDPICPGAD
jgi:hypothetical protein